MLSLCQYVVIQNPHILFSFIQLLFKERKTFCSPSRTMAGADSRQPSAKFCQHVTAILNTQIVFNVVIKPIFFRIWP